MKTLKMTVLTVLTLGFLWMGVPRCSEVGALTKAERQETEFLCRMVLLEHALGVRPEMLPAGEWRVFLRDYRAASALDDADLKSMRPIFPNHSFEVIDRLARRMRGR